LYGHFVEYYIFSRRCLLISDLETVKEVLFKRPKKFRRARALEHAAGVLQVLNGLFQAEGSTWQRIRKVTAPSFNLSHVSAQYPKIIDELVNWIERLALTQQKVGKVDMKFLSFTFTIRMITIIAFGLSSDNPLSSYFYSPQFKEDMDLIFRFRVESMLFSFPKWYWPYSSAYKHEVKALEASARFTKACSTIIAHKREQMKVALSNAPDEAAKQKILKGRCMVDSLLMLESNIDSQTESGNANDMYLSDEDIIANVKTFYMAGSDTTSIVLSWLAYYYACFPERALYKAREEATKVLFSGVDDSLISEAAGRGSNNDLEAMLSRFSDLKQNLLSSLLSDCSDVSNKVLNSLPYCLSIVKEILRISGPASTNGCQITSTTESVTFANGIVAHPNDIIWCNFDGLHNREDVWGEDAAEFRPSRWWPENTSPGNAFVCSNVFYTCF
jgi:cytochrome P450